MDLFEVSRAVLADRANDILGQGLALVFPSADLADESLLLRGLLLGLYVCVIVGIRHRRSLGNNARFAQNADEDTVRSNLLIALDPERHIGIDMLRRNSKLVFGTKECASLKLIGIASALESETLKNAEGRTFGNGADVHKSRLFDYVVRVIRLIDRNEDADGIARQLNDRVAYHTVVLLAVVTSDYVKTVADIVDRALVADGKLCKFFLDSLDNVTGGIAEGAYDLLALGNLKDLAADMAFIFHKFDTSNIYIIQYITNRQKFQYIYYIFPQKAKIYPFRT